ncbi:MAG TPA: hypothetical protein VF263_17010 [Longimicrobiaceae bacterium]
MRIFLALALAAGVPVSAAAQTGRLAVSARIVDLRQHEVAPPRVSVTRASGEWVEVAVSAPRVAGAHALVSVTVSGGARLVPVSGLRGETRYRAHVGPRVAAGEKALTVTYTVSHNT